jgi:hypothetical protein
MSTYLQRLVARVGKVLEYGGYRFRTPEEIVEAFSGKPDTQPPAGGDAEDPAPQS